MRTSASEISAFVKSTQPRSEPTDYLRKSIFPHGNVSEHEALVQLKHVYPDLHGQSHFDRFVEHHLGDIRAIYKSMRLDDTYAKQIGSQHASDELAHFKRTIDALRFYTLPNGITYDVGRRTKRVGDITIVCQADGLCENDRTVVEIKSPWGKPYTERPAKDWRHYLIQLALEVDLYEADAGLLVMYMGPRRGHRRPVSMDSIRLSRETLAPLTDSVYALLRNFSGRAGDSIYDWFDRERDGEIVNVRNRMAALVRDCRWMSVDVGESKRDVDVSPVKKRKRVMEYLLR